MRQENTETKQNELGEIEKIVSLNRVAKVICLSIASALDKASDIA